MVTSKRRRFMGYPTIKLTKVECKNELEKRESIAIDGGTKETRHATTRLGIE